MNFQHLNYAPVILIAFLVFLFAILRYQKTFFKVLKQNWFFKQSIASKFQTLFFAVGVLGLLISMMDLRGPEEKIETKIPDQKTIIIIDSSSSMLVEDVRPNRYKKSLLMARHFIKKSVGHQIAVVLFSDTQKRLVPFTDDIDLLDSRVAALEGVDIQGGGSQISQAILESIQYFKLETGKGETVKGNVLLFTDSEENENPADLNLPEGVSLAVVGVGTRRGGPIPIRDRFGVFRGYKQYNGEKVISKMDEGHLKKIGKGIKYYQYWVASSYTIPTDSILSFFKQQYLKKFSSGNVRIRPVWAHYILIPSIAFLMISFLFSGFKGYSRVAALVFIFWGAGFNNVKAVDEVSADIDEEKKVMVDAMLEKMKQGEMGRLEKLAVAEKILKLGGYKEAEVLYRENIRQSDTDPALLMNYGVTLIQNKKVNEGLKSLRDALAFAKDQNFEKEKQLELFQNVQLALRVQKKKNQGKGDSKEKKEKEKKGEKQQQEQNESQDGKEGKKGEEKKSKDQKKKDKKEKKDGKDKKDKKKKDGEEKKQQKPQSLEQKEQEIKQKRKMVKVPALIKQIMSTDRNIQKKYMDTRLDRGRRSGKKDW